MYHYVLGCDKILENVLFEHIWTKQKENIVPNSLSEIWLTIPYMSAETQDKASSYMTVFLSIGQQYNP